MPVNSFQGWEPPNPRLSAADDKESLYRYYAGYGSAFVQDALRTAGAGVGLTILDPWNGSGTTTAAARQLGCVTYGFDRNPVMVVVAKANLLNANVSQSLTSLSAEIVSNLRAKRKHTLLPADGLTTWLDRDSAALCRTLERVINSLLVGDEAVWPLSEAPKLAGVSSLGAFFYTAAFRTLRTFLTKFGCSNPTWIRKASRSTHRVSFDRDALAAAFENEVRAMTLRLKSRSEHATWSLTAVEVASSTALPLMDSVVDGAITSPPYCTRIDYVVASAPELAILGYSAPQWRQLRDEMIGTLTVHNLSGAVNDAWGQTCVRFLDEVARHESRASATYYLRTHCQYFESMFRSFHELNRVLRPGAVCVMVVQDSFYKAVHNDLASAFTEMGRHYGWNLENRRDFPKSVTLATINPRSRRYRVSGHAVESVLAFRKAPLVMSGPSVQ